MISDARAIDMVPSTASRVARNTASAVNRRIAADTEESIRFHARRPDLIGRRLRELEREWDIERVLEANASAIAFVGTALGLWRDRRWFAVPLGVTGFLFQHAVQGWCPPLPVLRRLGVRTAEEIAIERYALKALRGDFDGSGAGADSRGRARQAIEAARD